MGKNNDDRGGGGVHVCVCVCGWVEWTVERSPFGEMEGGKERKN